jgi:small subunit ribosomal protein S17
MKTKNIGIEVKAPKKTCEDNNCPFHGNVKLRGRTHVGTVRSSKAHRTATVEWPGIRFIQKYERYQKRRTKIKVHNPDCIGAEKGDFVKIAECRPLSKTKNFIIIEKFGKNIKMQLKEETIEADKMRIRKENKTEKKEKESDKKE